MGESGAGHYDDSLECGSDDLWIWIGQGGGGEWRQLQASVAFAMGGEGRMLEVRRTGHCVFVHGNKLYMYGGYCKSASVESTYCNDFVVLNLGRLASELAATRSEISQSLMSRRAMSDSVADVGSHSSLMVLRRLLAAVGATSSLHCILDDGVDDDDIPALSRTQPHKIATKYKMTEAQAQQLVQLCRVEQQQQEQEHLQQQQHEDVSEVSESESEECGVTADELTQVASVVRMPQHIEPQSRVHKPQAASMILSMLSQPSATHSRPNAFGNRIEMNSYSILSQFHFGALHVALKNLFPHTNDIDVSAEAEERLDDGVDDSEYFFRLKVFTLDEQGAGTDADVYVTLIDVRGRETNEVHLDLPKCELAIENEKIINSGGVSQQVTIDLFERGAADSFMIRPLTAGRYRPVDIKQIRGNVYKLCKLACEAASYLCSHCFCSSHRNARPCGFHWYGLGHSKFSIGRSSSWHFRFLPC